MQTGLISFTVALLTMMAGYFILLRKHVRPLKKQYEKLTQMQQKMIGLFSDFEDMIEGFEEYVEETKKELSGVASEINKEKSVLAAYKKEMSGIAENAAGSATRIEEMVGVARRDLDHVRQEITYVAQLQQEIREERNRVSKMPEIARSPAIAAVANVSPMRSRQYASAKQEQVLKMHGEGIPAAQIARTTGFSKGEVELIIKMMQKED